MIMKRIKLDDIKTLELELELGPELKVIDVCMAHTAIMEKLELGQTLVEQAQVINGVLGFELTPSQALGAWNAICDALDAFTRTPKN